jgi:predicted double-glycine peptidase
VETRASGEEGSMPLLPVPLIRQVTTYDCGVAAFQGVLAYYGIDCREAVLAQRLRANETSGVVTEDMVRVAAEYGLRGEARQMTLAEVQQYIDQGFPVILLIQAWPDDPQRDLAASWDDGHFVTAVGYDSQYMYFNDSSLLGYRGYLSYEELEARWHDIDGYQRVEHYGVILSGTPKYTPGKVLKIQAHRVAARWVGRMGR